VAHYPNRSPSARGTTVAHYPNQGASPRGTHGANVRMDRSNSADLPIATVTITSPTSQKNINPDGEHDDHVTSPRGLARDSRPYSHRSLAAIIAAENDAAAPGRPDGAGGRTVSGKTDVSSSESDSNGGKDPNEPAVSVLTLTHTPLSFGFICGADTRAKTQGHVVCNHSILVLTTGGHAGRHPGACNMQSQLLGLEYEVRQGVGHPGPCDVRKY
jgi:hypothetical protein